MRDGDPDAFGVLFDDSAPAVHRLAFRLTGNRHEAEEIVSLTFLEAWRQRAAMDRLPGPEAVPDFADELAGRIDDAARLAAVRAAFRQLRPAEQDVVALCVWSELDYVAAAQALGIPVGTVRSRLSRARRKLAAELGGCSEQPIDDRQPPVRPAQGGTR